MERTTTKPSRAGWREDEIDRLWREITRANESGLPLRGVFEQMGEQLGRRPNSVRNYYYMQLRPRDASAARRAAPFSTFTEEEVRQLVRRVLMARGRGQSVRACVMELAQGDHARMLRYQNKYRAVLKKRPELIRELCQELRQSGHPCLDPLEQADVPDDALRNRIDEKARQLGDPDVHRLLSGLDALMERAVSGDARLRSDRMRVQLDIALMRYEELACATGDMLLLCKEYLGQEEDTRVAAMPAFLSTLTRHVANVENAMG